MTRGSNQRARLGVDRELDRLPDPTRETLDEGLKAARSLLAQIEGLDRSGLSFDDALDLDLMQIDVAREIEGLTRPLGDGLEIHRKPDAGNAIGDPMFELMVSDPRPAEVRLADVAGRIADVPRYTREHLAALDATHPRWKAIEKQKIAGLPELFSTLVDWARREDWSGTAQLEASVAKANEALATYEQGIETLPTPDALHVGTKRAEQIVNNRGIELSLSELHGIATGFLARTAERIEDLRGKLVARYELAPETTTEQLAGHLDERFRAVPEGQPLERVLDTYRAQQKDIVAFIEENDLFPLPEGQELLIVRTPGFMAPSIPAGAMASPPPFREGVRRSVVFLTLAPDLVSEHTLLGIPMMMVHEGVPGHHLQLATASMHASIPRKHADFMDHGEGWTTMLEDYMLDIGYCSDLRDEVRFTTLRDLCRIGARVAIDLFFMTGERDFLEVGVDADIRADDPFVAARGLLQAVTGFPTGRAEAELNWYSQERGYPLSYLTGNHLVWQLKQDLRAGPSGLSGLDLDRAFHKTYLQSGNMPVAFLRRVFEHDGML